MEGTSSRDQVFAVVNTIPAGKVTSYGTVGDVCGISGWEVGRILSGLPEDKWETVMWQRVVAKDGYISSMKLGFRGQLQKELLQKENVETTDDTVDMNRFGLDSMDLRKLNE